MYALVVLVLAASCGAKKRSNEPIPPRFQLHDYRFKSGLRVIIEQDTNAPVAGVVNVVGAGAVADPLGKEGLAHLVEHLTFRAKQDDHTTWTLFQQAGAAISNAEAHHDFTVYYEFGPRDAVSALLALEANRIIDPLAGVDEETFRVEREVVRNELRQRGETFVEGAVWAALSKATYPDAHPYSRPVIGSHESLDRLTLADAHDFVKKRYRPANTTLVVTGDIPTDRIDKLLAEALPKELIDAAPDAQLAMARLALHAAEPPDPPPTKGLVTLEGAVTSPELHLAWSLPPTYGPKSHLAQIALGGLSGVIDHADDNDDDVLGGSVQVVPGVQASTVIARVVLREGSHPEESAELVLKGLVKTWDFGANSSTDGRIWFNQRIARAATGMMFESEDIELRGTERAAFTHFTGDLAYVLHRMDAFYAIDPGQLDDFYARYLNRRRARAVLVRPLGPEREATAGRVGFVEAKDRTAPVEYDLAAIRKIAVPRQLGLRFHTRQLKNGLRLQAARNGTTPIVTIGLTLPGGLAEERAPGTARVAWALAESGRSRKGSFSEYGALVDRTADVDAVNFKVRVTSPHLSRVLPIFRHHVTSLEVDRDRYADFERRSLDYMRRGQERPEWVNYREFRRALFGSHVFGHVGDIPSDRPPDRDALNRWIANQLTPERATLAIVGDIDPEEALSAAEDAFDNWSGPPAPPDPQPLGTAGAPAEIVTHRPAATQAVIRVGCRLPNTDPSQLVAAQIVARALSQRIGIVREGQGKTYGLGANVEMLRGGTAVMRIGGAVENAGLATALRTIRNEMTRLTALNDADIDRARWVLASGYNLGLVTNDDWVRRALTAAKNGWTVATIDSIPEAIASVDTSNVLSSLRTCASDGVLSVVGDEAIARRAIKEAWPATKPEGRVSGTRP